MYSFTNKHSKVFGYVSVLFTGLGFTIVSPVLPFLTLPYSHSIHQQAFYITLLMSVYALAAFLSAPILGSLSGSFWASSDPYYQFIRIKYRIFAFWFRKFDMDVVPWSYH